MPKNTGGRSTGGIVMKIQKPASVIEKENLKMATAITEHFMKVLNCKDVHELVDTCETIIDAAKSTYYWIAQ